MAYHEIPFGPASATCLQHVGKHWAGSPPNEIVASALGLMAYVDDVRRSGGDVVAGVERRGRPKTVLTIDPCRQYEYIGEELRYGVLDLNLGGEAEMQLGRLCAYVGPDGISRSGSIDDVVRDAIWTARWVADVFSHNQRATESQRLQLWWDRQPGNPDLRARDRWAWLSPADVWRAPKTVGAPVPRLRRACASLSILTRASDLRWPAMAGFAALARYVRRNRRRGGARRKASSEEQAQSAAAPRRARSPESGAGVLRLSDTLLSCVV